MLNTDYSDIKDEVRFRELIFTGPVDEYFDYCYGQVFPIARFVSSTRLHDRRSISRLPS